jgi:hypothetical protein
MAIKQAVIYWLRDNPKQFSLILECGHRVTRRVRKRRPRHPNEEREDPPPKWVYCERCAAGEKPKELPATNWG